MSSLRARPDPGSEPPGRKLALRWSELTASAVADHPGLVLDIVERTHDGVTISGIFTEAEIERALERLPPAGDMHTPLVFGSMLGMPLSFIGPRVSDRSEFFSDVVRARAIYADAFGFDPHERVAGIFAPMCGHLTPSVVEEEGAAYNPGNVRFYQPGMGGLKAHAGNEFNALVADGAMSYLRVVTNVHDHLSWFVVLQKPLVGGELSVYDLLYTDHPEHESPWGIGDRDDSYFDDYPGTTIDPGPGSMVIFTGGSRWHRINPVSGSRPRITYGGFAAPSTDGTRLNFWC